MYSDISPSLLVHGQNKFSQYRALRTTLLDVDRDPLLQGLNAESFDLVLAANVIHATPDIRRSVGHLRRVLRPGGYLILIETVAPSRVADCTVGLFDGWWCSRDTALRDGYPVISMWQWEELLRDEGFRVAILPVGNREQLSQVSVAVLVAVRLGAV
jgi:ubiquinone/menaquinone biosynthesis C-methylase UbiE